MPSPRISAIKVACLSSVGTRPFNRHGRIDRSRYRHLPCPSKQLRHNEENTYVDNDTPYHRGEHAPPPRQRKADSARDGSQTPHGSPNSQSALSSCRANAGCRVLDSGAHTGLDDCASRPRVTERIGIVESRSLPEALETAPRSKA